MIPSQMLDDVTFMETQMMHTPAHKSPLDPKQVPYTKEQVEMMAAKIPVTNSNTTREYFTRHPNSPVTRAPAAEVSSTLQTRANSHGSFIANGITMQAMKGYVRSVEGYCNLTMPQREALDMILHKIGRILNGNPNFADHWHDIAGYATLIENIINTGESHPTATSTSPTK